ncbi:MAG: creatininase family protein [Aureliella sp.]
MTLPDVRDKEQAWEVALLPLGATEPHNLHLPYGTDTFEGYHLARSCCDHANQRGAAVLQLPVLPYGTESNLREFPLAMNLQPTTLFRVLTDLVESVEQAGIRKLVLLNSHGGNDLKPFLREIYGRTNVHLFLCNWYQMIQDAAAEICKEPEDHAGEMETSLILHFRPDLVKHDQDGGLRADPGEKRPLRFRALREGWVGISRPWHLLTTNTGAGNPHAATAEKGRQLTEVICERIGGFLLELSNAKVDEYFPFEA